MVSNTPHIICSFAHLRLDTPNMSRTLSFLVKRGLNIACMSAAPPLKRREGGIEERRRETPTSTRRRRSVGRRVPNQFGEGKGTDADGLGRGGWPDAFSVRPSPRAPLGDLLRAKNFPLKLHFSPSLEYGKRANVGAIYCCWHPPPKKPQAWPPRFSVG